MLDAADVPVVAVAELFSVLVIGPAVWTREPRPPVLAAFALAVRLCEAPIMPPIVAEPKGEEPLSETDNVLPVVMVAAPDVCVTFVAPEPPSETLFRATSYCCP